MLLPRSESECFDLRLPSSEAFVVENVWHCLRCNSRVRTPPLLVLFVLLSVLLSAQDSELGRTIYAKCAKSVFMLYAQGDSGEFVAQGSGFWVAGKKIVTNAHVANAGKMYVDVGSARFPATIQSVDAYNDLAILKVDVEITATPLTLAELPPAPGETIFAIGNPHGLERSISQGVISGQREIEGRELLQITAPISHGSSGGPIVDPKGQVIGVAVGFLESGQSLNFAVPASRVIALIKSGAPKLDLGLLDEVESLRKQKQNLTYSNDPDSDWQITDAKIKSLLKNAFEAAGNNDSALFRITNLANDNWDTDIAVSAADRLVAIKPSSEAHAALAEALTHEYMFNKDDSEKQRLMVRTEKEARLAVSTTRVPSAHAYSLLANVLEDRQSYKEAKADFALALAAATSANDSDLALSSTRGVIRCADALLEFDEANRLLDSLRRAGESNAWDWSVHADNLDNRQLYQRAADAYRASGELNGPYTSWCSAAVDYTLTSKQEDSTLFCARQCIEKGTGLKGSEAPLANAHREIASVLNGRGVYIEGLNHAKEATVLSPENAFGYDEMAVALIGLHRFSEAVSAGSQAIRLSDGKYGWMHFNLGSAYFQQENWSFALQSFEKAAELSPQEPASAFNTALCNQRLGHFIEAIHWYEEYLRRKPDADDRTEILARIRALKQ